MIKVFMTTGFVGGLVVAYLVLFAVGPISQLPPPESLLTSYRAQGAVPAALNLPENEEVEHGVFEVPPEDEIELARAIAAAGDMGGMNMGGDSMGGAPMQMDGDEAMTPADGAMTMADDGAKTPADGAMTMAGDAKTPADGAMTMAGDAKTPVDGAMTMADGDAKTPADGAMTMADGDAKTPVDGAMTMAGDEPMKPTEETMEKTMEKTMDMTMGDMEGVAGGLRISDDGAFDREIDLQMTEWGFSDMNIEVKMGERIRFNVTNKGEILHEFMVMEIPAMQAVAYRASRADWNLLEHEALFEKSLVLPDGGFSFVLEVRRPGTWMFMCMLPYHMQMGMMGQLATEGMAMQMEM